MRPIGALNIAMPAVRYEPQRQNVMISHLQNAARSVLQQLGLEKLHGPRQRQRLSSQREEKAAGKTKSRGSAPRAKS